MRPWPPSRLDQVAQAVFGSAVGLSLLFAAYNGVFILRWWWW